MRQSKISEEEFKEFLLELKELFESYLEGKASDLEVSNKTIEWYSLDTKLADILINIDPRIKELSEAMDITHPGLSEEKKKEIIKKLLRRIEEMLDKK